MIAIRSLFYGNVTDGLSIINNTKQFCCSVPPSPAQNSGYRHKSGGRRRLVLVPGKFWYYLSVSSCNCDVSMSITCSCPSPARAIITSRSQHMIMSWWRSHQTRISRPSVHPATPTCSGPGLRQMVRCVRVPRAAWPRPLVAPSHRNVDLLGAGHNTTYTALNYGLVQECWPGAGWWAN